MDRIVSRRPSPATIISLVALFVALGGTSYAAIALAPNNSVGSAQVINGSLLKKDLSRKTVAALKGNLVDAARLPLDEYLDREAERFVQVSHTEDAREAARAYVEKSLKVKPMPFTAP